VNRTRCIGLAALVFAFVVVPVARAQASLRPTNTERPVVAGSAFETETLTLAPGEWASDDAVSYQYRWQRCGGAPFNVALNKPAYASNEYEWEPGFRADAAVDGSPWTYWSAGDWPPQWIEVDLKTPYPIGLIRASITQLPDGFTTHHFLARGPNPLDEPQLLGTFSGETVDEQVLEQPGPSDEAQFIRIETTESPSWVAWREIEVLTDCDEILATGPTYTLTAADVGSRIRGVVVASNSRGSTSASSVETPTVERLAPLNLEPPAISGTAKHNQLIFATAGTWRGSLPITYSYQWQKCASGSVNCSDIPQAVEPSFVVRLADAGSVLRVAVTATNAAGSTTVASAATDLVPYQCIVPLLKRRTLTAARARLRAAHCRLGSVRRAYSKVRRGRIVSQRPRKGTELPDRGKVSVVISRGRR
jgi:hypothetical protein